MATVYYRDERAARECARIHEGRVQYDKRDRVWCVTFPLDF